MRSNTRRANRHFWTAKARSPHGAVMRSRWKSVERFRSTLSSLPRAVTASGAQNVTQTSAALLGTVDAEGAETSCYFEYISEAGYWSAFAEGSASPYAEDERTVTFSVGSGDTPEAVGPTPASGLVPGTTYHYALVATNKFGAQGTGQDGTFTTLPSAPPTVSTGGTSGVSQSSATLAGTVGTSGLQTNYGFEIGTEAGSYGPATGLGSIGGAATETVSVTLGELQPGTTYFYRITASNADGTAQGQSESFATPGFPTLIAPPPSSPLIAAPNIAFPLEEVAMPIAKKLKNAEKLAKALKACRKEKPSSRRMLCERHAKKKYPTKRAKKK